MVLIIVILELLLILVEIETFDSFEYLLLFPYLFLLLVIMSDFFYLLKAIKSLFCSTIVQFILTPSILVE